MIPVYTPWVARNQKKYVNQALDENKLTFHGRFVERFERQVAEYVGARHCVAVMNGSVALYAMYEAAGLRGKRVVTADLTYAATVAQLLLLGCEVAVVPCNTILQMNPDDVDRACREWRADAVVVPHLYGDMTDMDWVGAVCRENGAVILEDAAEAFGCVSYGKVGAGLTGRMGTFSFFANKVITCGEGGAVVTDDDADAAFLRKYVNQGVTRRFYHEMVGTNFRMTNLQAAVGSAQMEDAGEIVARKKALAETYRRRVRCLPYIPQCESTEWMPVWQLPEGRYYGEFEAWMAARGVEVRPVFTPLHRMPAFSGRVTVLGRERYGRPEDENFILPSSPGLTDEEIDAVVGAANDFLCC